jgi:energy-coupling factor transporter ATP-binding protein EcfA2
MGSMRCDHLWRISGVITDRISVSNVKGISSLDVKFTFPKSNIVVVTGKNGVGKTSLVKSFSLIADPRIFEKSAGLNAVGPHSSVEIEVAGFSPFSFVFNKTLNALDTKDMLPPEGAVVAELPIPFGRRFQQFSLISSFDAEIRANIAAGNYEDACELVEFLSEVYGSGKFEDLKSTVAKKYAFYFLLLEADYYVREDHLSSGEFFLIQIYRLITSGAKLVLVDELDVALDAAAQIKLYRAMISILEKYGARLIVISHSLGFMSTVDEGGLYYLEDQSGNITLEQRSFGYVKSDLYGFSGKDRYIITEDDVLGGFTNYLIQKHIATFFQYEIIAVGGQPQIDAICGKNDLDRIFSDPENVIVVVDGDLNGKLKYSGLSEIHYSPVDDIELYIFQNKEALLPNVNHPVTNANKDKDNSKKYWKRLISSGQKNAEELYELIENNNIKETERLVAILKRHLCLDGR